MKLLPIIQKNTQLLLLGVILVNVLLCLASGLLGEKSGHNIVYLFIYAVMFLALPALLTLLFVLIYGFMTEGFSKTVDGMKTHLVLAFFAICSVFGFIIYAHYFIR